MLTLTRPTSLKRVYLTNLRVSIQTSYIDSSTLKTSETVTIQTISRTCLLYKSDAAAYRIGVYISVVGVSLKMRGGG
ncbi:hypothetical protein ACVGWR_14735, partial [Enterobacter hormaechei]